MKEELINGIICMLKEQGIETDGIRERLYLLMRNVEVNQIETALAVRDETLNEQLIKRFLGAKVVKGCTNQTITYYKDTLRRVFDKINKSVPEITSEDIRVYLAYRMLKENITKVSADNELRTLKSFFSFLSGEGLVPKNPTVNVDKVKPDKKKKKAFTEMECERIRRACRNKMEKAIVEILFSTACRANELIQIQISEINCDKILVHGKGSKDRIVYLNAKTQIAIEEYLAERKDNNPYLFPALGKKVWELKGIKSNWYHHPENVGTGHKSTGDLQFIIRTLGERAGISNVHPHRFRRTCATLALRRGMPIEQVSKMLGHEQIVTTQIYLDMSDDELESAHRKYVT